MVTLPVCSPGRTTMRSTLVSLTFQCKSRPGRIWKELAPVVKVLPASSTRTARNMRCCLDFVAQLARPTWPDRPFTPRVNQRPEGRGFHPRRWNQTRIGCRSGVINADAASSALNETLAAPRLVVSSSTDHERPMGAVWSTNGHGAGGTGVPTRSVARSVRAWTPSVRVRSTASLVVVVHAPPLRA